MISIGNDFIRLPKYLDKKLVSKIDSITSYQVIGAEHSPQFKAHLWDGKQHFLKKNQAGYILPTGLLPEIYKYIKHLPIVDAKRKPAEPSPMKWCGPDLRDYQIETVAATLKDRGLMTGRGMLNLPIRSGKTMVAAAIIAQTGVRTLFIVESKMLLHQTVQGTDGEGGFRAILDCDIGKLGDGIEDIRHITVATVQTLLRRRQLTRQLLRETDLLIVDECHHLKAPEWGKLLLRADCFYKLGMSATIFMSKSRPNERSAIWFRACTGPILTRVSPSRLIQDGHLYSPVIQIYTIKEPQMHSRISYQTAYKEGVELNDVRNGKISDLAAKFMNQGLRVLVDTGRLKQVSLIQTVLRDRGYSVEQITGKTPSDRRQELLNKFRLNSINCLVGTVLGEGIDIPELEVVINAEGQKSRIATIQRMRNLTACAEKSEVIFVDFNDDFNKYLRRHSKERIQTYQSFRHFKVEFMDE